MTHLTHAQQWYVPFSWNGHTSLKKNCKTHLHSLWDSCNPPQAWTTQKPTALVQVNPLFGKHVTKAFLRLDWNLTWIIPNNIYQGAPIPQCQREGKSFTQVQGCPQPDCALKYWVTPGKNKVQPCWFQSPNCTPGTLSPSPLEWWCSVLQRLGLVADDTDVKASTCNCCYVTFTLGMWYMFKNVCLAYGVQTFLDDFFYHDLHPIINFLQ